MRFVELIEDHRTTLFPMNQLLDIIHSVGGGTVIIIKIDDSFCNYPVKEEYEKIKSMISNSGTIITLTRCYAEHPDNVVKLRLVSSTP